METTMERVHQATQARTMKGILEVEDAMAAAAVLVVEDIVALMGLVGHGDMADHGNMVAIVMDDLIMDLVEDPTVDTMEVLIMDLEALVAVVAGARGVAEECSAVALTLL